MIKKNHNEVILEKYLKAESNQAELEEVFELFSQPHNDLFIRPILFRYWKSDEIKWQKNLPDLQDPDSMLDKIHHLINIKAGRIEISGRRNLYNELLKIASILIIGIFTGMLTLHLKKSDPVYYKAISPKGSVSQVVLPDKSIVFLNADTEIKYTEERKTGFSLRNKKIRTVFLNGEAWFDVSENVQKPFMVNTSIYNIEVLGTRFNVKAYPEDNSVTTTLERGLVKISSIENLPVYEEIILKEDEQFIFDRNKGMFLNDVNTRMYTAWKENKLIFINMNLKDLFVLLERKYGVDIEVSDNTVLNYHYDSTIKNETIIEVLDLIAETLPIKYKIEGQKIIISNNKK